MIKIDDLMLILVLNTVIVWFGTSFGLGLKFLLKENVNFFLLFGFLFSNIAFSSITGLMLFRSFVEFDAKSIDNRPVDVTILLSSLTVSDEIDSLFVSPFISKLFILFNANELSWFVWSNESRTWIMKNLMKYLI